MDEDILYIIEFLMDAVAKTIILGGEDERKALERAFWDTLKILESKGIKLS